MFAFLTKWFTGGTKAKAMPQVAAQPAETKPSSTAPSSTGIRYNPDLVASLKKDHQVLLGVAGEIVAAWNARNSDLLYDKLHAFKDGLNGHLLTENVKFYAYLEQRYGSDEETRVLIHQFRQEMNGIAKAATAFIRKYHVKPWTDELHNAFKGEFDQVATLLVKRIEREENQLYTLYQA